MSGALPPSCRLVGIFSMLDEEGLQLSQDKKLSHHNQRWVRINYSLAPTAWKQLNALCCNRLQLMVIGHVICSQLGRPRRTWQCNFQRSGLSGITRRQCCICMFSPPGSHCVTRLTLVANGGRWCLGLAQLSIPLCWRRATANYLLTMLVSPQYSNRQLGKS